MIVLDTHALVWWASGSTQHLSSKALRAIEKAQRSGEIIVSSISSWELAMLTERGRLALAMEIPAWLDDDRNTQRFDLTQCLVLSR
jgi:hypothetical protein